MSKKFTANQLAAIRALENYIQQLAPGAMFASLASIQLQLAATSDKYPDMKLEMIQGWLSLMTAISQLCCSIEFAKDLNMLKTDLENQLARKSKAKESKKQKTPTKETGLILPPHLVN